MVCGQHYKARKWFLCTTYDLKHVIKYHTAIKWADGRATGTYFCENRQTMFKVSSRDYIAISGSMYSTTSLVDSFYVPHMVFNTS